MNSIPSPKVLIIIPAYNEENNIRNVICETVKIQPQVDVVVIDDGSSDGTKQKAKSTSAQVIALPFNLGVGGAVQTGLKYAARQGYDIAVQLDGDGQHDPQFLPVILAPILKEETDMVIGSRFIPPYLGYQSSFIRRIGINFFAHLISLLTGYAIADPTSGFRAFNKRAITIFKDDYPVDFPEPEAIVLAKRYGLRVIEQPVQMRERLHGLSSIRYLRTLYYMVKVTFAILMDMIKNKEMRD